MDHGRYRKSAFAGMHDELQRELLPTWSTDGTEYRWSQRGRVTGPFGKVVEMVTKTAGAENVWNEISDVPFNPNPSKWKKVCKNAERYVQRMLEQFGEEYVMNYFRDQEIYENDGEIEDKIAYLKRMSGMTRRISEGPGM